MRKRAKCMRSGCQRNACTDNWDRTEEFPARLLNTPLWLWMHLQADVCVLCVLAHISWYFGVWDTVEFVRVLFFQIKIRLPRRRAEEYRTPVIQQFEYKQNLRSIWCPIFFVNTTRSHSGAHTRREHAHHTIKSATQLCGSAARTANASARQHAAPAPMNCYRIYLKLYFDLKFILYYFL